MGRAEELMSDQTAAIRSLCEAGKANMEINNTTGLLLHSLQQWTHKLHDAGGS